MKRGIAIVLTLGMVASQALPLMAEDMNPQTKPAISANASNIITPTLVTGTIVKETEKGILVEDGATSQSVALNITADTYIIDAVSGKPIMLKNRTGDMITAYYGPSTTKSMPPIGNAVAIICSAPEDYSSPYYAKAETVTRGAKEAKVTISNGAVIATIKNDAPISAFQAKNTVTIDNIKVGTNLLLWSGPATLSYPGQVTITKAVILDNGNGMKPTGMAEAPLKVEKKTLPAGSNQTTGELPLFAGGDNPKLIDDMNRYVDDVYAAGVEEASKDKKGTVHFSYETIQYQDCTSLVIHTIVSAGNTAGDKVHTIVFDSAKNKRIMLEDVLGGNAYPLADQFVHNQIANAKPGMYSTEENGFKGFESEPSFYVDKGGNVAIMFDKYSIAPGSAGTPVLTIPKNNIVNYEMPISETYMEKDAKMVPLRMVAEAFGYTLKWNAAANAVTLTNGKETHVVNMNQNLYDQRKLEYAPKNKNGKLYVPISFFETILGGCYTADDVKIVFSKIK